MSTGLPKEILELATQKEKEYIKKLSVEKMSLKLQYSWGKAMSKNYWALVHKNSEEHRGVRLVLRKRYSNSLKEGVYRACRSSICTYMKRGMFGTTYGGALKKNEILVWVERDELERNWFLTSENKVVTVVGAQLDGIRKISEEINNG